MKCPACPETLLVMTERTGVEIDYCPTCRGVWLDRGELDKIIDRVAAQPAPAAPIAAPTPAPRQQERYDKDRYEKERYDKDRYDGDRYEKDRYGKKRKSLLGEIFDF